MFAPLLLSLLAPANAQVTATFPNGATNPATPSFAAVGSTVNQTSFSRLLSLNGVDDFCLYGPPEAGPDSLIGNVEPVVVAYCTKPRNNARLIPDGAITAAHIIRTPLYIQIHGFWDGTKVNIPSGDFGGELDPHGAENLGNPIGGNVTSNVGGSDVFYEEWMSFISYDQFCLRICTAETANVTTALQCEHELDIMGCQFVMAIPDFYQSNNSFTSCDGDPAPPPGLYPLANGSTSTFRQRYTGTYVDGAGQPGTFTVGQTVTPSAPAYYGATSNCKTFSTISNGINTANYQVTASPNLLESGGSNSPASSTASASASGSARSGSSSASASSSRSGSASGSASRVSSTAGASGGALAGGASASASAATGGGVQAISGNGVWGLLMLGVGMMLGGVAIL